MIVQSTRAEGGFLYGQLFVAIGEPTECGAIRVWRPECGPYWWLTHGEWREATWI